MFTRNELKEQTRNKIIDATLSLILQKGFIRISSKEIAKASGVAQGSIFLHFGTKISLLNYILSSNIDYFENMLKERCVPKLSQELFIRSLLEVYEKHEDILSRIFKDYSYLDSSLTRSIDSVEVVLKNLIFNNYKRHSTSRVNIVDSFMIQF